MKKIHLFVIIIGLLMVSTALAQPSEAVSTTFRPVSLIGPNGSVPFFQWVKTNLIPVIFGMKDANFTAGNVLYSEFTTNDKFGPTFLPVERTNSSLSVDLTSFKTRLTNYLSNQTSNSTLDYLLSQVLQEIGSNTNLDITSLSSFISAKNVDQLSHFVVILYDPDKSVINALNDIRSNQTLTSQPFTGDEVLTVVRMDRSVENIFGKFLSRNIFKYDNGTLAKKLIQFGVYLNNHPHIANFLMTELNITNELGLIRNYALANSLINTTIYATNPLKDVNVGFTVSQMQIGNLTLGRLGSNVIVKNFGATLVESHALGLTIYNDTNNNGIMDMNMKTINSAIPGLNNTVLPSGSNEALYRVDFKNATCTNQCYSPLSKTTGQDELTFSFNAQNVGVDLNPVSKNIDESLLSNSSISQIISNFGYTFHFTTNSTDNSVNVKFDYHLGDWSNTTFLKDLSINQMFLTGVSDFTAHQRILNLNNSNNTNVNGNSASYKSRKFLVAAGQSPAIASIDLGTQVPYTWNGTSQENANGQTLPLLFAQFMFGSITSYGDVIRTIGGSVTSAKYLYSLSYPEFSGFSISHDPTFSMVANPSSTTSSSSIPKTGVPGFEFVAILALPVLIAIKKKKN